MIVGVMSTDWARRRHAFRSPSPAPGHADQKGDVRQFLVWPGAAFAHQAVAVFAVTGGVAVVGGEDDHGIVPQAEPLDPVDQPADPFVHHGDLFREQHPDVVKLLPRCNGRPDPGVGKTGACPGSPDRTGQGNPSQTEGGSKGSWGSKLSNQSMKGKRRSRSFQPLVRLFHQQPRYGCPRRFSSTAAY